MTDRLLLNAQNDLHSKPDGNLSSTCTAVGTCGVVEPAASFIAHVGGRAEAIYVGAEEPANSDSFTECRLGKAGEVLPDLLGQNCAS